MYGFEPISKAARALEKSLETYHSYQTGGTVELLGTLIDACQQAVATAGNEMLSAPANSAVPNISIPSSKPLLLIVDDDDAVSNLLTDLFKEIAEILTATNSTEALELIKQRRPDLVILDHIMPGNVSGLKLLETIQNMPELASIPIIMLTANDTPIDMMRGIMSGAAEYIAKPFDPIELAEKVHTRLKRLSNIILIADDDLTIRELLALKLRQAGLRVLLAEDGTKTLETAQSIQPNLLILDYYMPKSSGIMVLKKLRDIPALQTTPVLFITANENERNIEEVAALGAEYIVKPFIPEEVVKRCLHLLNLH
jgi:DNA-binding response OmpR family regulator